MNSFHFEAEITRGERVPRDVVRERAYGPVRVSAEWLSELAAPELRVALEVAGEVSRPDAPAYVELFFHDLFLLLNLSTPGSFSGTISISGGELRVRELTFSARVFEYAAPLSNVPLDQVIAWYDALGTGTRQIAHDGAGAALFVLLQLARGEEDEEISILRLARAAEALALPEEALRRLLELRERIGSAREPVLHPMHDDALDPRVHDATSEWIEVADEAARMVITALQERAGGRVAP